MSAGGKALMCLENPVTSSSVLCRVIWVIGIFPLPWHFPAPFPCSQQGRELCFGAQFLPVQLHFKESPQLGEGSSWFRELHPGASSTKGHPPATAVSQGTDRSSCRGDRGVGDMEDALGEALLVFGVSFAGRGWQW